jgi:hypothetical protein
MCKFEQRQWSTVIIRPSLLWRIRALFKRPEIIFCWGENHYMTRGFQGETYFEAGGVPVSMRKHLENQGEHHAVPKL